MNGLWSPIMSASESLHVMGTKYWGDGHPIFWEATHVLIMARLGSNPQKLTPILAVQVG